MGATDYNVAAGDLACHAGSLRLVAKYLADDFDTARDNLLAYRVAGLDDRDTLGELVTDTIADLYQLADELNLAAAQLDETATEILNRERGDQ